MLSSAVSECNHHVDRGQFCVSVLLGLPHFGLSMSAIAFLSAVTSGTIFTFLFEKDTDSF